MKKKIFQKRVSGLYILGEVYVKNKKNLLFSSRVKPFILKSVQDAGLTSLGFLCNKFPNGGFSAVVNLAESHLALHTWPEFNFLTIDIYTCNYSRDNSRSCRMIFDNLSKFFNSAKIDKKIIKR